MWNRIKDILKYYRDGQNKKMINMYNNNDKKFKDNQGQMFWVYNPEFWVVKDSFKLFTLVKYEPRIQKKKS